MTHIWYTGVIRHASGEPFVKGDPGCPYSICDYYDVNPYLAGNCEKRMEEFERLVNRTHKAGLKVIIDFVPNHIACNYKDAHGGIPHFDWHDYDWSDTLKIDYNAPGCWEAMRDIVLFWANKGVDGMRCDMVELVPIDFFHWLIESVKSQFPDFIFIAEAYDRHNYSPLLDYAGFDLLYDKSGIYDSLRAILTAGMTAASITWNWQSLGAYQPRMLNFLENHDEQRLASPYFAGNAGKGYAALAVAALFNTASFMLYAGQECGENASESDNGRTSIFNWTRLNSVDHPDKAVLERYKEILSLAATPLYMEGENFDLCYCNLRSDGFNSSRHFAFLRFNASECQLVVCNFSEAAADITIHIPLEAKEKCHPSKDSISVCVPANDAVIVKL